MIKPGFYYMVINHSSDVFDLYEIEIGSENQDDQNDHDRFRKILKKYDFVSKKFIAHDIDFYDRSNTCYIFEKSANNLILIIDKMLTIDYYKKAYDDKLARCHDELKNLSVKHEK